MPRTTNTPANDALEILPGYDPVDLAAAVGGLLLIPSNAHHHARLETFAHLVLEGRSRGSRQCSAAFLNNFCNDLLARWVGYADDPWETLFTEAFTFHGGSRVFIPGGRDSMFILRNLASPIAHDSETFSTSFREHCTRVIQAIALISDTVANRAGIARNLEVPQPTVSINVPAESILSRLKLAVRFTPREFDRLLAPTGATAADLQDFFATLGCMPLPNPPFESSTLESQPLLKTEEHIIVLAPHLLAQALIRWICSQAIRAKLHHALAEEFHLATMFNVENALRLLGLHRIKSGLTDPTSASHCVISHHFWQFDADKLLHVAIITDALNSDTPRAIHDAWPTHEIEHALSAARTFAETFAFSATPTPNELLSLLVCEGIGRNFELALPRSLGDAAAVYLAAADLEAIAFAEGKDRDPLLLWKFASAYEEQSRKSRFHAWSPLDIYGFWKKRGRRFLFDNEPSFTGMFIDPGVGAEPIRREAVRRFDWHTIPSYSQDRILEVGLVEGPDQPVYAPRSPSRGHVERAVVIGELIVWVISNRDLSKASFSEQSRYAEFVRTVAYWIWQFSRALPEEFQNLAVSRHVTCVAIDLGPEHDWEELSAETPPPAGPCFTVSSGSQSNRIDVRIEPTFLVRYTDQDNLPERDLSSRVIAALISLAGPLEPAASALTQSVLDKVAPVGPKRMMHRIDSWRRPEFIGREALSRPRHVQDFDGARTRQKSAEYMRAALSGSDSPREPAEVQATLNRAVGGLYADLQRSVSQVSAVDALHSLLLRNEALVADDAEREFTLASQLACYASEAAMVDRLKSEIPKHAIASLATRFLIEYVAARPPRGLRPMSDSLFDEWIALAAEIVTLGTASDISQLHLADVSLSVHPNGYLIQRGSYQEALEQIQAGFASDFVKSAQARQSVRRGPVEKPPEVDRLDAAARAEFGHSLTELTEFLGDAISIAQAKRAAFVEMRQEDFFALLEKKLHWPVHKLAAVLTLFSLAERKDFLEPPPSFRKSDIWPWKFHRALSYIRRPFVRLGEGQNGPRVLFTPGHTARAAKNLAWLCLDGRLKATSSEMRRIMSALTTQASDDFNKEVEQTVRSKGFDTRLQVTKIAAMRLTFGSDDLGDIDVLVIDRYRKRLWLLECKDFRMARAPHEVRSDLEELFLDRPGHRAVQEKHKRRMQWVRAHLSETLEWLGMTPSTKWTIHGAIVLSTALISPLLGHATIPVWTMNDLLHGKVLSSTKA